MGAETEAIPAGDAINGKITFVLLRQFMPQPLACILGFRRGLFSKGRETPLAAFAIH